jgi:membrane protein implicated in regulation of membrane protease activity
MDIIIKAVKFLLGAFLFCFGSAIIFLSLLWLLAFLPYPFGLIVWLGLFVLLGIGWGSRGRSSVYDPNEDAGGTQGGR